MRRITALPHASINSLFKPTGFIIVVIAAMIFSFVATSYSLAASLSHKINGEGNAEVALTGEIMAGDAMRTAEYMDELISNGQHVSGLVLNSSGGLVYEGFLLARLVMLSKVATITRPNAICASACFLAFVASPEKWAAYRSRIGVHGASSINGGKIVDAAAPTLLMVRFSKILGAPYSVVGKMAATPPNSVAWLTIPELEEMGVRVYGKPSPQQPASRCQDPICEMLEGVFEP